MTNESGKTTFSSLIALVFIGYIVYCGFIFISAKVKSDSTQKEIADTILKYKVKDDITQMALGMFIKTLEVAGYILDNYD